jgi:HEAT repeat protein
MNKFIRLFNLRRNELPRLLHAASIFLLVAINDGIVKSVAAAVFNIRAGVDQLPLMYTWIAVLFSLSMVLLSYLTSKVTRQRLLFGMMGSLGVVLAFNSAMLFLEHSGSLVLAGNTFYSFLFISSEIVRSLTVFQIWVVAAGICYTSRAKVLFPLLAASTTLGDISGGFAVRFLGPLMHSFQLYGLAAFNMVLIIVLLRPLVWRYFVTQEGDEEEAAASLSENLRYFGQSVYLRLLFVLSIAVFALYTAVHYSFNVIAKQFYPSEAEITGFFGLFYGFSGVATLFATTLLLRLILRWLGVGNVYMWICAFYAAVSIVLAAVLETVLPLPIIGTIFVFNLVNFLLLDSIIAPTYQLLIKLVPQRHSDGVRMILEGGFMLLGGLLGAGVTALHANHWLSLGELFQGLVVLSVVMVVCGWYLKRSYTEVLIRAVREQDIDVEDDQAMESLRQVMADSTEFPRSLLLHHDDGVRQMGIEILRQNPGPAVQEVCLPLITHENGRIRSAALDALGANEADEELVGHVLPGLDDEDGEVRLSAARLLAYQLAGGSVAVLEEARRREMIDAVSLRLVPDAGHAALQAEFLFILEQLQDEDSAVMRELMLQQLLESDNVEELVAGVQTVHKTAAVGYYLQLMELLHHAHPAVREAVIHSLADVQDEEVFTELLGLLEDPDPDVVDAVVGVLGGMAAPELRTAMVEALPDLSLKAWEGVLAALLEAEDLAPRLLESCRQRLVEANRHIVAMAVLEQVEGTPVVELLIDQLGVQNGIVQNGVVRLLGHLGDVGVVGDLLERLSGDDPAARENAVELLENIADRDLLTHLLPLVEEDAEERQRAAQQISGWEEAELEPVLIYLLGSTDLWTQMAAMWTVAALDRHELLQHLPGNLAPQIQESLESIESKKGRAQMAAEDLPLTTMEKITFLKESPFFAALPLEELYHIALTVQEEGVRAGTTVIKQGTRGDKMYIVVKGELEVRTFAYEGDEEGQQVAVLPEKQVFGDMALLDDEPRSASVIALQDARLLSLQRSSLERLLRRYSTIASSMMKILSRRLRLAQG